MKTRLGAATTCALVLVMVLATTAFGQTPWTKIDKLLVKDEAYVLGTLQVDGAITTTGGMDLDGDPLTIGADGGVYLDETADDVVGIVTGAGTGTISVLTGNLKVGNGTSTQTLNGEDAYVEGLLENDGGAYFDGAVTAASTVAQTLVNAAGGSANPWDYTGTLGIMNTNDDFTALDVNITNANHTGTGNTVQGLDIAGITADAEATETGILVGAGWDYGLDVDGNVVVLGADGGVTLDESSDDVLGLTFGAGAGYLNVLTGDLKVGNGSPGVSLNGEDAYIEGTFEVDGASQFDGAVQFNGSVTGGAVTNDLNGAAFILDPTGNTQLRAQVDDIVTLTSASGTGTWSVITGNFKVGNGASTTSLDGEDAYVEGVFENDGGMRLDGAVSANSTIAQNLVNGAGASANPWDYTGTLGIMDNNDDFTLFDVNVTNADHTGSTNTVQVLDVANITGDAQATETAIRVGTGWDAGLSVASPAQFTSAVNYVMDMSVITTDTVLTAAESGTTIVFKNTGVLQVTATLPAAAAGLHFCAYNYDGDDIEVDVDAADQIHVMTNAAGDELDNTTAGDSICLVAVDGTDWIKVGEDVGTWTDD